MIASSSSVCPGGCDGAARLVVSDATMSEGRAARSEATVDDDPGGGGGAAAPSIEGGTATLVGGGAAIASVDRVAATLDAAATVVAFMEHAASSSVSSCRTRSVSAAASADADCAATRHSSRSMVRLSREARSRFSSAWISAAALACVPEGRHALSAVCSSPEVRASASVRRRVSISA